MVDAQILQYNQTIANPKPRQIRWGEVAGGLTKGSKDDTFVCPKRSVEMSVFVRLKALLERLATQVAIRQAVRSQRTHVDYRFRKAAFLSSADRFRWSAPGNYRFDRDEANER